MPLVERIVLPDRCHARNWRRSGTFVARGLSMKMGRPASMKGRARRTWSSPSSVEMMAASTCPMTSSGAGRWRRSFRDDRLTGADGFERGEVELQSLHAFLKGAERSGQAFAAIEECVRLGDEEIIALHGRRFVPDPFAFAAAHVGPASA